CPAYPEEGTLKKATWMSALGTLYPNSPSIDSAALLSSNTEESLPKVSPPPYESPTVPAAASAPPADTALSAPAASLPPPEDTDTTAGTFSALHAWLYKINIAHLQDTSSQEETNSQLLFSYKGCQQECEVISSG
ncbi:hypothetical protein E2320_001375, partial [Naja naja]